MLKGIFTVSRETTLGILRPLFLQLRDSERLERIGPAVLDILRTHSAVEPEAHGRKGIKDDFSQDGAKQNHDIGAGGSNVDVRARFRRGLALRYFGRDGLLRMRLRFAIADFCWVSDEIYQRICRADVFFRLLTPATADVVCIGVHRKC